MQKSCKQYLLNPRLSKITSLALLALVAQTAAHATYIKDAVELHGYGHQGYLQSNDNLYLN